MNLNAAEMDNLVPQGFSRNICMVQYAIVQHFDQKLQKTENFYFASILKLKHPMSSDKFFFFHRKIRVSENSSLSF